MASAHIQGSFAGEDRSSQELEITQTQAMKRPFSELSPEPAPIYTREDTLRDILDERLDLKLQKLNIINDKVDHLAAKTDNIDP